VHATEGHLFEICSKSSELGRCVLFVGYEWCKFKLYQFYGFASYLDKNTKIFIIENFKMLSTPEIEHLESFKCLWCLLLEIEICLVASCLDLNNATASLQCLYVKSNLYMISFSSFMSKLTRAFHFWEPWCNYWWIISLGCICLCMCFPLDDIFRCFIFSIDWNTSWILEVPYIIYHFII
jgi:hypothetical protein